jgi:hypothetical protein
MVLKSKRIAGKAERLSDSPRSAAFMPSLDIILGSNAKLSLSASSGRALAPMEKTRGAGMTPVCGKQSNFANSGVTAFTRILTALCRVVRINGAPKRPPYNRPRRLAWPRTSPFHGGNTGSNPVGDANLINNLRNCWFWRTTGYATVELLNHSTMCVAFFFRHGFVVDVHRDCVRGMPQQALHYFGLLLFWRSRVV